MPRRNQNPELKTEAPLQNGAHGAALAADEQPQAGPAKAKKTVSRKAAEKKAPAKSAAKTPARRSKKTGDGTDSADEAKPRRSDDVTTKAASAAGKQLIIVESPAKARTIEKYLG